MRLIACLAVLILATAGWNPFITYRDAAELLDERYSSMETGIQRRANGVYLVRALTRMPDVKADMVRWWFADYMQTTEQYQRWHPTAHVWMDWENKQPGKIIGASHLVHEYIGSELSKLRIQFVDPATLLDGFMPKEGQFVICARAGLLEEPINVTSMCHIVRDTEWGAEMRSVFWLGHIAKRNGNDEVFSFVGLIGNTALARLIAVDKQLAKDLMIHAIEEMGFLANFLPHLYEKEKQLPGSGNA